ncbi:MAG: AMP-binding protein [Rhodobacteraceae bacterium]|nr:AMP-binding protein [Paracoccaceae bacterium]
METLPQILARNVRALPDRPFLIFGERVLSYRDFSRRTARLANLLAARGVGRGDRVGLYLPSIPLMAEGVFASQRLGAIPAPLSAMLREDELAPILSRAGLAAVIAEAATWPVLAPLRARFPELARAFVLGGGTGAEDLEKALALQPETFADPDHALADPAALFFSSGTTGTPKGVLQSHFSHASTLRDMMVAHGSRYGREVYLCAVPLFTNFGLTATLNLCMYTGGTLVLHERWDTGRVLADIGRHRATFFGGTPTMYVYLVEGHDPARHDLSSLRVCITGGAPVPGPVIRRFEAISGVRVAQVYGATETCGQNVIEPVTGLRREGAAGLAVGSSRIAIVDEAGAPLPAGAVGEIVIGGDCMAMGYFGDPAATAAAFTARGWRSGDLGCLDADGFLFVVDRKKDLIIAGGHNIQPLEVESVLYRHPGVALCAVVGLPDAVKGEIPVAVIVARAGTSPAAEAIRAFCREHLAAYKVPRRIEFIDEMPVVAAKIRKRDLVAALREGSLDRFRRPAPAPVAEAGAAAEAEAAGSGGEAKDPRPGR